MFQKLSQEKKNQEGLSEAEAVMLAVVTEAEAEVTAVAETEVEAVAVVTAEAATEVEAAVTAAVETVAETAVENVGKKYRRLQFEAAFFMHR